MRPPIPTSEASSDAGSYAAGLQGEQVRNAGDAYRHIWQQSVRDTMARGVMS